jgi:hypothetical protein
MIRTIAIGVGAAMCFASLTANAQTGYGVKPGAPSTSSFDRHWNRAKQGSGES